MRICPTRNLEGLQQSSLSLGTQVPKFVFSTVIKRIFLPPKCIDLHIPVYIVARKSDRAPAPKKLQRSPSPSPVLVPSRNW